MTTTLHDATVRAWLQILGAAEGFLEKGLQHCRTAGIDPGEFVQARLAPDMLPLRFQVRSIAHHSIGAIEGVRAGVFRPPPKEEVLDYPGLQALVAAARQALMAVSADEVDALAGRDVLFDGGQRQLLFVAADFWLTFSVPNFYFHATTAYDILRHRGVPLGKRDYIGTLRLKPA